MTELVDLFQKIGLSEQKAKDTAGNKKIGPTLESIINESKILTNGSAADLDASTGSLLLTLASTVTKNAIRHVAFLANAIASKDLKTTEQVQTAIKFAEKTSDGDIDKAVFDKACGVGVVVTDQQIKDAVTNLIESRKAELVEQRYRLLGQLLGNLRSSEDIKWGNPVVVKEELEKQVLALLGPKDDRDDPKKAKAAAKKANAEANALKRSDSAESTNTQATRKIADIAKTFNFVFEGELSKLHKPGGNPQIKPELMEAHLKATGGKVKTRFPPEPNGFLHIGHAKAININFSYAQAFGGTCYLRYDDTNPEAEELRYFDSILETVEWLGFKPDKITYSSDYFQELYELAVECIKRDKAYICHCTAEDMHEMRGGDAKGPRRDCPHRNRPIEESLEEFEKMKQGRYKEGEATLRMKMDMQNPNPQFWDLVAYRVLFTPHVRSGDKWCIYPTYDFTHCLCDSFENITHSLCTTEFRMSRESYFWLCDAVEVYKPVQWEYGRLNITNTVLSKRKLMKLVDEGFVSGWDDPRLFTLMALRRRGFTPEAINAFVRELGVTTTMSTIEVGRLENYVREHLNDIAPRIMAVMDPIKVVVTNVADDFLLELTVPNKPRDDSMGSHMVPFTKTVYIDGSDFREEDDPNYYRLAPGKTVGLLYVPEPITCTNVVKNADGSIKEIHATYGATSKKPKTYIQWVAESKKHNSPIPATIRLYSNLFKHSNPYDKELVPGGWLSDVNPESLVVKTGFVEVGVRGKSVGDKFQFQRVGYFCIDQDSNVEKDEFVFNRTVTLKEDAKKDA